MTTDNRTATSAALVRQIVDDGQETDTKARIINAAEELFATHGLQGVSTRQITARAGQRNESAIHYHFGNRSGLIQAIVDRRTKSIDRLRNLHLDRLEAEGRSDDLRGLCACVAYPQLDLIRETGGRRFYARFVDEVLRSHSVEGLEAVWKRNGKGMQRTMREMRRVLADLPDDIFIMRFTIAISAMISGLATIEKAYGAANASGTAYDPVFEAENLLDMATAAFSAPISTQTAEARAASSMQDLRPLQWPPDWVRPTEE